MKLADIKTFVVANPPPGFGGPYFVFVKLTTACGISGVGEAYGVPFDPHLVAHLIEDVFARHAEGEDPHDIESLWRRVYSSGYTQRPDLTQMGVLSALEMACWDIVGKAAGQPVHKLLGGRVHERLRAYTYIYPRPGDRTNVYADPDLAASIPNFLILEGIEDWGGFHARILKTPIRFEDGYVIPPDTPGLGVELDEAVADAHPWTGDRLHLEMAPRPL
jgi:L-alanine-DL-glutamate epimerase-like enolase superfamily enzyme